IGALAAVRPNLSLRALVLTAEEQLMKTHFHFTKSVWRGAVAFLIMASAASLFAGHTEFVTQVAGPVTVGIHGKEPLVTTAPDGTIYISALQHLYRST